MLTWGKALLAGLGLCSILGMTVGISGAAQAQALYRVGPGVVVASDLDGPDDDLPPPPPRYAPPPYERAYPGPPPRPAGPPPGYGPSAYGGGLPIQDIYRIVRRNGYSPLGSPQMRGNVVTITVLDEDGEDGRLVIDAYSGRILRFVPAYTQGSRGPAAVPVVYGPPPGTVPAARPSVPLPKPRVTASLPDRTGTIAAQKPAAAPQIPPAPPAAVAAAQTVPASQPVPPKPAFAPQPTQAMPPAQSAE